MNPAHIPHLRKDLDALGAHAPGPGMGPGKPNGVPSPNGPRGPLTAAPGNFPGLSKQSSGSNQGSSGMMASQQQQQQQQHHHQMQMQQQQQQQMGMQPGQQLRQQVDPSPFGLGLNTQRGGFNNPGMKSSTGPHFLAGASSGFQSGSMFSGADSLSDSDSQDSESRGKRIKQGSPNDVIKVRRKLRKNTREKQRRQELNDQFDKLSLMLNLNRKAKTEKYQVLTAAIGEILGLRQSVDQLRQERAELHRKITGGLNSAFPPAPDVPLLDRQGSRDTNDMMKLESEASASVKLEREQSPVGDFLPSVQQGSRISPLMAGIHAPTAFDIPPLPPAPGSGRHHTIGRTQQPYGIGPIFERAGSGTWSGNGNLSDRQQPNSARRLSQVLNQSLAGQLTAMRSETPTRGFSISPGPSNLGSSAGIDNPFSSMVSSPMNDDPMESEFEYVNSVFPSIGHSSMGGAGL